MLMRYLSIGVFHLFVGNIGIVIRNLNACVYIVMRVEVRVYLKLSSE